ncbi:MAG: dTDP-4-amino-4,6-dideoxygalactose transaminase [Vampirovibrionia bacterium]
MNIPFNVPCITGNEQKYISQVLESKKISGDGQFTKLCNKWLVDNIQCKKALLTTSCTHALEMAALLINIKDGDEIIMPSYTFVSTANAFVIRGGKPVFVDINPQTMNIDEKLIINALTSKTKAIVVVHYAGVSCEMNELQRIAKNNNLYLIEDAAQAMMSTYENKMLGSFGDLSCFSFHESKNYVCGEGGALLINNDKFVERAEIIREKGTNRSQFFRGEVDKYSWLDVGSSYLPSELNAAYLYAQFEMADVINKDRLNSWNTYYKDLKILAKNGHIELPVIPDKCKHNAHTFYIKLESINVREKLQSFLKQRNIYATFHYVPLHSSIAGKKYGTFNGIDNYTTRESDRLLRLPMYYKLKPEEVSYITSSIIEFFK